MNTYHHEQQQARQRVFLRRMARAGFTPAQAAAWERRFDWYAIGVQAVKVSRVCRSAGRTNWRSGWVARSMTCLKSRMKKQVDIETAWGKSGGNGRKLMARRKYGNRRVTEDGHVFDSVAERNHYISLKLLAHAGEIQQLQVHPKYVLQEGFTHKATGKRVRAITYTADFAYVENGQPVTIDIKGARTEAYKIKAKLFMARYPHIRFEEVAA